MTTTTLNPRPSSRVVGIARHPRPGFTLIELLIVIGIIGLLIMILFPVVGAARESAARARCMSNIRTLTQGWTAYVTANAGAFPFTDTPEKSPFYGWVQGGNSDANIRGGTMFRYAPDVNAYRCPHHENRNNVRTYSINWYLNGPINNPYRWITHLTQLKRASEIYCFTEEYDPRGYNMGGFAINPAPKTQWIDPLSWWHRNGCVLSYCDGHAEFYQFVDPRTARIRALHQNHPGSPDLAFFQARMGF